MGTLRELFGVDKRKKVWKKSMLKKQNLLKINDLKEVFSARDWIRTSTSLRTLRPEHSASTNFATRANFSSDDLPVPKVLSGGANISEFLFSSNCISLKAPGEMSATLPPLLAGLPSPENRKYITHCQGHRHSL